MLVAESRSQMQRRSNFQEAIFACAPRDVRPDALYPTPADEIFGFDGEIRFYCLLFFSNGGLMEEKRFNDSKKF
ncbi:hypothetical protein CEXT_432321 [Caerostris extrusa]|uniref:Uncharacterized protein n=1 Tax=Caerostris extrusa TaxID=172846 RepID=A0AAV4QCU8_CAEEX|nr:hypothetical protein CEXT_432321 [Caerostris extrusa]